jgi:DNA primase
MIINLEEGSWFCFGCGLSGDAYKFVKLMESKHNGLDDLQSYKVYLDILKSDKCSSIKISTHRKSRKPVRRELYNQAYDFYYGLKKTDWGNLEEPEEIEAYKYMSNRGFDAEALNKCRAKITYNKNYSIVFPMIDNGKFKGWVCRTTDKDIEKKRKYLYNKGFRRAETLVGSYGLKPYVFIVEGYMDRLKFLQFGESNVAAILGWKMSSEQIKKLKDKGVNTIISALDNDPCGKRGTAFLKEHFNVVRFRYLKGIKDPGEMTQQLFDKMYKKTMIDFRRNKNGFIR